MQLPGRATLAYHYRLIRHWALWFPWVGFYVWVRYAVWEGIWYRILDDSLCLEGVARRDGVSKMGVGAYV
jgi:hypothetical protein